MKYSLALLPVMLCAFAYSQTDSLRSAFKINVPRILVNEVQLFYERPLSPKFSIEYELGFIYPNRYLNERERVYDHSRTFMYYGILAGAGLKKYYTPDNFHQLSLVCKFRSFANEEFRDIDYTNNSYIGEMMSSKSQVLGLRYMNGRRYRHLELSWGIGINRNSYKDIVYSRVYHASDGAEGQDTISTFPIYRKHIQFRPVLIFCLKFCTHPHRIKAEQQI